MIIEIASVVTKMSDNVPARARGLPVDHPVKIQVDRQPRVVERHPANSGSANDPIDVDASEPVASQNPAAKNAKSNNPSPWEDDPLAANPGRPTSATWAWHVNNWAGPQAFTPAFTPAFPPIIPAMRDPTLPSLGTQSSSPPSHS